MPMDAVAFRAPPSHPLRAVAAVFLAAVVALIAPQACAACTCLPMTFAESVEASEVVFVGTVTARQSGVETPFGPGIDASFTVDEVYRGDVPAAAVVRTADNSAACGVEFVVGESYLVLAHNGPEGLESDLCMGSSLAGDVAAGDLESLGDPDGPSGTAQGGAPGAGGGSDPGASRGAGPGGPAFWWGFGSLAMLGVVMGAVIWWPRRERLTT
jgi:hypothetical protein